MNVNFDDISEKTNKFFLKSALMLSGYGSCIRRNFGCVIVDYSDINDPQIVASGYTHTVDGRELCKHTKSCIREKLNIESGTQYELCKSCHAEQNALINAKTDVTGCVLYVAGRHYKNDEVVSGYPCYICAKLMRQSGINDVVTFTDGLNIKHVTVDKLLDKYEHDNELNYLNIKI